MTNVNYIRLLSYAELVAEKATKLLIRYQKKAKVVKMKDLKDLVTSADLASEKLIIKMIRKKFPQHGIFSEEAGGKTGNFEFVWIVDPLDGTKEYARGLKEYNCLIAVEHKDQLVVGVQKRIGTDELYSCTYQNGAYLDHKPIKVSTTDDLAKSFIGVHLPTSSTPVNQTEKMMVLTKKLILSTYRVRPGWDDAHLLSWVARGVLDGHIITSGIKNGWYDLASGILLVGEAGGIVTDMNGDRIKNRNLTNGIVASNGKIHEKLLQLIRESL